jgi:hypothetical protein
MVKNLQLGVYQLPAGLFSGRDFLDFLIKNSQHVLSSELIYSVIEINNMKVAHDLHAFGLGVLGAFYFQRNDLIPKDILLKFVQAVQQIFFRIPPDFND